MFPAAELFGQNARFSRTETVPVSDPDVSRPRLLRDAIFLEVDRREIGIAGGAAALAFVLVRLVQ